MLKNEMLETAKRLKRGILSAGYERRDDVKEIYDCAINLWAKYIEKTTRYCVNCNEDTVWKTYYYFGEHSSTIDDLALAKVKHDNDLIYKNYIHPDGSIEYCTKCKGKNGMRFSECRHVDVNF